MVSAKTPYSSNQAIFVCNPLTQKWISLPPPPAKEYSLASGFECFSSSSSLVSASFKVIHIPRFEDARKEFKVEVFCSELGGWTTYDVSCPGGDVTWVPYSWDNVVTHNGVYYCFQKKQSNILAVGVNGITNHGSNDCRLINLPDQALDDDIWYRHRLGESEGLICYAIVEEREKSLSVWVLEEDWCLLYKDDKFHGMVAEMEILLIGGAGTSDLISQIRVLGFSPVDRYVVILSYGSHIWTYNVRTKGHEQLSHPSFLRTNGYFNQWNLLTFALKPKPTVLPPISW